MRDISELGDNLSAALRSAVGRSARLLPEAIGLAIARHLGLRIPRRVEIGTPCEIRSVDL